MIIFLSPVNNKTHVSVLLFFYFSCFHLRRTLYLLLLFILKQLYLSGIEKLMYLEVEE